MQSTIDPLRAALAALPGAHTVHTIVREPPALADRLLAEGEAVPEAAACARVVAEGTAAGPFPLPAGVILRGWCPVEEGFAYTVEACIDRTPAAEPAEPAKPTAPE